MTTRTVLLALMAPLALSPALAQHAQQPQPAETITLDAQGHSPEWEQSPHWREFYTLSVEMLRGNASPDVAGYEQKSYAIFRAFAQSLGASPEGMIDHLKNIPREIVGIVKDDPKVLDSYENFLVALRGPR
ncbi:MAG TPA: hypothetical protein VNA66_12170 [Gammaproteobacteria bacterium]|jgi:hypothetical protein|nr:hypothetical protein [Gammaproteobacteria bacterium]